jgi:hypothetical protein
MSVRYASILMLLLVCGVVQVCCAEEVAGKLARVDLETVTVIGSDHRKVSVRVDPDSRFKAAKLLGKTVTVDVVSMDEGQCRAISFRQAH